MTTREDAIEAGAKALVAGKTYGGWARDEDAWRTTVRIAEKVVDAVAPIIRADEREYLLGRTYVDREHLRAQVEALPPHGGGERMFVWREDVLALLGGESDGS